MSLLPDNLHPSWHDFLDENIRRNIECIENSIGTNYNPGRENVLRFFQTNLDGFKVVILGQDPYPEKGVATGRAFEVGTLKSWSQPFRQVSLKNLVRLIYKERNGLNAYESIPTFSRIVREIEMGSFQIAAPTLLFESLEKQGVLLLNTCFTVTAGEPLSHKELWRWFSEELISFISKRNQKLNWFLWGKNAQSFRAFIYNGIIYESRHPMMCSKSYADDFLKSDCIRKTKDIVNWSGI